MEGLPCKGCTKRRPLWNPCRAALIIHPSRDFDTDIHIIIHTITICIWRNNRDLENVSCRSIQTTILRTPIILQPNCDLSRSEPNGLGSISKHTLRINRRLHREQVRVIIYHLKPQRLVHLISGTSKDICRPPYNYLQPFPFDNCLVGPRRERWARGTTRSRSGCGRRSRAPPRPPSRACSQRCRTPSRCAP